MSPQTSRRTQGHPERASGCGRPPRALQVPHFPTPVAEPCTSPSWHYCIRLVIISHGWLGCLTETENKNKLDCTYNTRPVWRFWTSKTVPNAPSPSFLFTVNLLRCRLVWGRAAAVTAASIVAVVVERVGLPGKMITTAWRIMIKTGEYWITQLPGSVGEACCVFKWEDWTAHGTGAQTLLSIERTALDSQRPRSQGRETYSSSADP